MHPQSVQLLLQHLPGLRARVFKAHQVQHVTSWLAGDYTRGRSYLRECWSRGTLIRHLKSCRLSLIGLRVAIGGAEGVVKDSGPKHSKAESKDTEASAQRNLARAR